MYECTRAVIVVVLDVVFEQAIVIVVVGSYDAFFLLLHCDFIWGCSRGGTMLLSRGNQSSCNRSSVRRVMLAARKGGKTARGSATLLTESFIFPRGSTRWHGRR